MNRRFSAVALAAIAVGVGGSIPNVRAALSIEEMMARMKNQVITGATVITHGYSFQDNGGDYMLDVATAIRNRVINDTNLTNDTVWLVDYDIGDDGEIGMFDDTLSFLPGSNDQKQGHVVFMFDWAPESNRESRWWAESAGDALFAMMTGMGIVGPRYEVAPPLQMIAHSFGTGVTSEAVERLAAYSLPVSQVTYLDPHDFDQAGVPVDEDQKIFELGKPSGYGATIWNNVAFADAYYQTRGNAFGLATNGTDDPEGRPIPGAYNRHLDGAEELPAGNPYNDPIYESDHGYVWNTFYRATIDGVLPVGADPPAAAVNYNQTGWAYSVFNPNRVALPEPNFYGAGQDHEHSSTALQTAGSPNAPGLMGLGLTEQQVVEGRWAPGWTIDQIANGNFAAGSHDFIGTSIDIMAGWTHHAGTGGFALQEPYNEGVNYYTQIFTGTLSSDLTRKHNLMYVPLNATTLEFDNRILDGSENDTFEVFMGETLLGAIDISQTDQTWRNKSLQIPRELRDTVTTLTFKLTDGSSLFDIDHSTIDIDTVRYGISAPQLQTNVAPGSIIDLGYVRSGDSVFLPEMLSMANIGDSGSILDVYRVEYFNFFPVSDVGQFLMDFAGAVELEVGGDPLSQGIYFDSYGELGRFETDITYSTTVGPQTFRLQVTVVPEPAAIVLLAFGCVVGFRRV